MSIYKQREADSKSYGFSTPSFSVPRHKPMLNPNRSLNGFVFGKVPIQHRGTMPSKPAPIRRTESPKGASTNSRRRGGRKTTNLRNKIRAGPCVLEEGEYRCFKPAVVFLPMGVPFGGVPFGVGCSVGSSGKPSSPTAIQIRPLRGRCCPHAVQGQHTLTTQRDDVDET